MGIDATLGEGVGSVEFPPHSVGGTWRGVGGVLWGVGVVGAIWYRLRNISTADGKHSDGWGMRAPPIGRVPVSCGGVLGGGAIDGVS